VKVDGEVIAVALSPDVDFAAAATRRDAAASGYRLSVMPLVEGARPIVLTESDATMGAPAALAVSPDGSSIVATDDQWMTSWSVATKRPAWRLRGHSRDTKGASFASGFGQPEFTPDGKLVVVELADGPMGVVDAASGRLLGRMGEPVRVPTHLEWSGNDTLLAGSYGHLAVWDAQRGAVSHGFDAHDLVAFTRLPTGDVAAVRSVPCTSLSRPHANLWFDGWTGLDMPAALALGTAPNPALGCDAKPSQPPEAPARLAWPPPRGVAPRPIVVPGAARKIDVEHRLVVVPSKPAFLAPQDSVLDLATGVATPLQGLPRTVATAMADDAVLSGGWFIASVRDRGRNVVDVWNPRTGALTATLAATGGGTYAGVSRDGRFIAIGSGSHLGIFELPSAQRVRDVDFRDESPVVASFVDGANDLYVATVAEAAEGNGIHHVTANGEVLLARDPGGQPTALVPSPDGKRLASLGRDGAIRLWGTDTRRLLGTLVEFDDDEYVAYTPGGAYAGTAEVAARVGWIFDSPIEPFRFEQFASMFSRADLVQQRLAGADVDAAVELARPPRVEIESAKADPSSGVARLDVHVSSGTRVGDVRVYVEGRSVASRIVCAPDARIGLDAPLMPGRNRVTVIAYDDRGFASNPVTVDLQSSTRHTRPELWAVGIGVSAYPNLPEEYQLAYAEDDARGVVDAFARQVGDGKPYSAIHSTTVLGADVTPKAVTDALATLAGMKEDDVALVFFAGHGVKPTADEDMVFLTSRAAKNLASVRENSVGWRAVSDALASARGRVVVVLDACHSGHLTQELVVPNGLLASALVSSGRAGAFVFAAAKGRQTSFEPAGTRGLVLDPGPRPLVVPQPADGGAHHGFFTGALLASLASPETDADGDGAVQMSELVDAVTDRVALATKGQQVPWVARREIVGDFAIAAAAKR
jgi:WD40 repeat protein